MIDQNEIIQKLPSVLRDACLAIPAEFTELTVSVLGSKILAHDGKEALQEMRLLRIAFWVAVNESIRKGKTIQLDDIYGGVGDAMWFRNSVLKSSYKLAYMLKMPASFDLGLEDILYIGLERM